MTQTLQNFAPHWFLIIAPTMLAWLAATSNNAIQSRIYAVARRRHCDASL